MFSAGCTVMMLGRRLGSKMFSVWLIVAFWVSCRVLCGTTLPLLNPVLLLVVLDLVTHSCWLFRSKICRNFFFVYDLKVQRFNQV